MAHRDTPLWLASTTLVFACVAIGCASAHAPETSESGIARLDASTRCGPSDLAPDCARPLSGSLACCTPAGRASCVGGSWQCAASPAVLASSCARLDSVCESADASSPAAAWQSCVSPTDCLVRPASCCGMCGAATSTDMIGVSREHAFDYAALACPAGSGCPACFAPQDSALIATCTSGLCVAVDLRATRATECTGDADCQLAMTQCCACGGVDPGRVVSIARARASDLNDLICDPGTVCGPCPAPTVFPPRLSAGCDAGRCVVRRG